MAKVTLPDIGTLANNASARQAINENFAAIKEAFENTLSRDGELPNQMEADLDLNDNDLLNVKRVDASEYFQNGIPWEQSVTYGDKIYDIYSGDGARVDFPLRIDPASLANLEVSVSGLMQRPGLDYVYAGDILTFVIAPAVGTNNILIRYDFAVPTGITTAAAITYVPPSTGIPNTLDGFLDSLWETGTNKGATQINTIQEGDDAVARTVQSKLRERISVKDFGATGDGVTDDTAAIQAAIDSISPDQSFRGGTIYLPRGKYKITAPLTLTSYAIDNAINIGIEGDGWLSTWIDARDMGAGEDAIFVSGDQQVTIKGFFLIGSATQRDGIHFGDSGSTAVSMFNIEDVRVQGFGRDGFHHYNSYMGTMVRCYALANGRDGFRGDGFHTSLSHQTCYALDNAEAGFNYNGIVYSSFVGCGSDLNQFGYVLANARSVVYNGCGAEGNAQDGWWIYADQSTVDTSNPLFVQECYDVRAVTLTGCSGYANNQLNAGYAGLVRTTANGVHSGAGTFNDGSPHTVDIVVTGCDASNNPSGTKGIVTAQAFGGASYLTESNNYFPGGRTIGSGTIRRDESLIGKSCTLTLSSNQSIPTSIDTAVNWGVAIDDIGGCWVIGSPNVITIPAALDGLKVVIKFQAAFAADNTGARIAMVFKNGSYVNPMPRAGWGEADFYNAVGTGVSPPVRVLAGDQFQLIVQQNTAGALNFSSLISYLSIEVVG